MPTRTFSFADVINITQGWDSGPTTENCSLNLLNINIFQFGLNGSGSYSDPTPSQSVSAAGSYVYEGDIDYAGVSSPIPPTAQITEIRIHRPVTSLSAADAANDFEVSILTEYHIPGFILGATSIPTLIDFGDNQTGVSSPASSTDSQDKQNIGDDFIIDFSGFPISRNDLITNFSHVLVSLNINIIADPRFALNGSATASFNLNLTGATIAVTYTEEFTFTFPDPEVDGNVITVEPGQSLVIEGDTLEVDEIETITLQPLDIDSNPIGSPIFIPASNWTIIGNNLTFIVPSFPTTTYYAQFNITSTQFSGSITLGQKLVLYFYNAPGIYKFVPGQRFDTYYNRPGEGIGDDDTFNTAIPRPFAKTGYL